MKLFFLTLLLTLILCSACQIEEEETTRPNILLMVADDMGYADLGSYGGKSNTPNLYALAERGIRFTNFYAASSNCSPSRAGLMTGKSPAKVGMYNYRPPGHPLHLRSEEVTIAEVVKAKGYQTAHIGKWHLGCLPQDSSLNHPQPHEQGFDYSLGTENNAQPSHLNPVNFVRNGIKLGEQQGYSCQLLADEAIGWFENQQAPDAPFFMYMAFHEPHAKVASPPELVAKYANYSEKDAEYLANIENLDLAVGRVLDYLEGNRMMENTLIIFSSDNGSYRKASNGPLKAVKSYVYDGGIRVPCIVYWSALANQPREMEEATGFVDVMPTIQELVDAEVNENLDGTSILGLLKGEAFEREKPLYWYFYRTSPEMAMRLSDMMILGKDYDSIPRTHRFAAADMGYIRQMDFNEYELYDLSEDVGQTKNLITNHPQAEAYQTLIDEKLEEIQEESYIWKNLPEAKGTKRIKTDWVKY
jgi:arylsulfatase A